MTMGARLLLVFRGIVVCCTLNATACSGAESASIPEPANGGADSTAVIGNPVGSRLDSLMTGLKRLGYSGSVLVEQRDTVILERGFGWADRKRNRPAHATTIFDIGSVAKTITALSTLRLISENKLQFETRIADVLQGIPEDKGGITIRQLLNHTSGLPTYHDQDDATQDYDQALGLILSSKLRWAPGSGYGYSNSGYTLLAMIIERVHGTRFTEAARVLVLDPARMEHTGWEGDGRAPEEHVAHGYFKGRDRGAPAVSDVATYGILGAGGMYSTVQDLLLLSRALRSGRIINDAAGLLLAGASPGEYLASLDDRTSGWTAWRERGGAFFEKGGHTGTGGFTAIFRAGLDSGSTMVLLMNSEDAEFALGNATTISRALGHLLSNNGVTLEGFDSVANLQATTGRYSSPAGSIEVTDNKSYTRIAARGQPVINALLDADPAEQDLYAKMNEHADKLFRALRAGGSDTISEIHSRNSAALLRKRLASFLAASTGNITVLGTVPEWVLPSAGLVTFVEYGSDNLRTIRLHWSSDGILKSIGGGVYPDPLIGRVTYTRDGPRALFLPAARVSPPLRIDKHSFRAGALTLPGL